MAGKDRNLNIGITSSFDGRGFKSAEQSAQAMERELNRQEQAQRRVANMQTRAAQEMAAAEAEKAAAIERLNERQREAMEATGKVILGVSTAAAAGMVLAGKAAMDWETAWTGVTKTVDGSDEQLANLEEQLRGLARTLPATHGEIAAVAEAAGQLGIERESVASFTKTMIDLGETTNLTADEASTALAQLMNIMGTSTDDVDRLGATIVALGNDGASTERDIVTMAQRIAGAGKLVGASEGEVLALASALSSMGVSAELGGGVASRVLQDLYSVVQSGGEDLEAFAKVAGMSAQEFATAFRNDPVRAMADFAGGLNNVEASGGNVITTLSDLGIKSSEEQRILLQMKAATDLVTDSLDLQAEAWDANTALIEEANKKYATTEARLQMARNQINDAAIDIGGNFLPVVAEGAETIGALAASFGALPVPVQQWVTGLGAAATAVGLLGGAALIAVPKLVAFQQTVDAMNNGPSKLGKAAGGLASFLTGPWGIALAAGALAVGAWAKSQGEARLRVDELTRTLDEQTGAITDNTREWAVNRLFDSGAIDAVKNLGLDVELVTEAMLGNSEAVAEVNRQLETTTEYMGNRGAHAAREFGNAAGEVKNLIGDTSGELDDANEKWRILNDITGETTDTTGELTPAMQAAAAATEEAAAASEAATEAYEEWAAAIAEADADFIGLQDGYQAIIDKNREMAEETAASTEDAKDSWEDYYDGVSVAMDEYLAELEAQMEAQQNWETNMLLLSGRVSQGVLDELAKLGPEGAPLVADLVNASDEELARLETVYGQRSGDATRKFADNLDAAGPILAAIMRDHGVEAAAEAAAALAAEEKTLADVIAQYDLNFSVDADLTPAKNTVAGWQPKDKNIKVWADVRYHDPGPTKTMMGMSYDADGSVKEFYAGGGLRENHVAQIAPAGTWRVWAEPETGGEGYVPLAPAKRPRSELIMDELARRLGGAYIPSMYVGHHANGAVLGGAMGGGGAGTGTATFAPEDRQLLRDFVGAASALAGRPVVGVVNGRELFRAVEQGRRDYGGGR